MSLDEFVSGMGAGNMDNLSQKTHPKQSSTHSNSLDGFFVETVPVDCGKSAEWQEVNGKRLSCTCSSLPFPLPLSLSLSLSLPLSLSLCWSICLSVSVSPSERLLVEKWVFWTSKVITWTSSSNKYHLSQTSPFSRVIQFGEISRWSLTGAAVALSILLMSILLKMGEFRSKYVIDRNNVCQIAECSM